MKQNRTKYPISGYNYIYNVCIDFKFFYLKFRHNYLERFIQQLKQDKQIKTTVTKNKISNTPHWFLNCKLIFCLKNSNLVAESGLINKSAT